MFAVDKLTSPMGPVAHCHHHCFPLGVRVWWVGGFVTCGERGGGPVVQCGVVMCVELGSLGRPVFCWFVGFVGT